MRAPAGLKCVWARVICGVGFGEAGGGGRGDVLVGSAEGGRERAVNGEAVGWHFLCGLW